MLISKQLFRRSEMVLDDRFWDIYMRVYDLGVATPQPYQKLLDEVIGLLPKNLDHSVVVETGCGTGNVLKRLFVTHDPDTVYGLERNELALKIAQPKLQRARRNVTDHSD